MKRWHVSGLLDGCFLSCYHDTILSTDAQVVASSCTSLRELHLHYKFTYYFGITAVKVPRDLHVILGHIGDLESLTLSGVRVPSTVFTGMAAGALPRLTEIHLGCSAVRLYWHLTF